MATKFDVLDALDRSIEWLEENPDKHTSGTMARDKDGFAVSPFDESADCFCVMGRFAIEAKEMGEAVVPIGVDVGLGIIDDLLRLVDPKWVYETLTDINDKNRGASHKQTPEQSAETCARLRGKLFEVT